MRWQDRFTKERLRFFKGASEISSFKNMVVLYGVIDVWLKVKFNRPMNIWESIIFFVGAIIGQWCIGFFWDKVKLYQAESRFSNDRNPLLVELRQYLRSKKNGRA